LKYYSQWPRNGTNLTVHQGTHIYAHIHTQKKWNIIHSLKNKEILSFVTTQEPEGHYANMNKIDIESQLLHDLTYSI
jgi:hypothetical protein